MRNLHFNKVFLLLKCLKCKLQLWARLFKLKRKSTHPILTFFVLFSWFVQWEVFPHAGAFGCSSDDLLERASTLSCYFSSLASVFQQQIQWIYFGSLVLTHQWTKQCVNSRPPIYYNPGQFASAPQFPSYTNRSVDIPFKVTMIYVAQIPSTTSHGLNQPDEREILCFRIQRLSTEFFRTHMCSSSTEAVFIKQSDSFIFNRLQLIFQGRQGTFMKLLSKRFDS